MKLQVSELPIGKPQSLRKTPKIAPFLVTLTVLFTIIPLYYYPSLRYNINNPNKTNDATTSSFDSLQESIKPAASMSSSEEEKEEQNNYNNENPKLETDGNIIVKRPESAKEELDDESSSESRNKPPEEIEDPTRLPGSTKSNKSDQTLSSRSQEQVASRKSSSGISRREKKRSAGRRRQRDSENVFKEGEKRGSRIVDSTGNKLIDTNREGLLSCDLFKGEWVPNPEGPYYTNSTCWAVQEHQNCMKFGRPDTGFLKWRWKPDGCELPLFDPEQFLEFVRGKSIAFVGDSVARNHMQSLICLLSKVIYPEDLSKTNDQNQRWVYKDYNFNISMFWAPYLVRTEKTDPNDVTKPFNLYLDEFDQDWTTNIETYDYVIISAGHWFFRPTMFYVDRRLAGCLYCPQDNVTHLTSYFSYRRAFRTAFRAINSLENFKGVTFLRTFAPSHFEGGLWDKGGDCVRTRPFKKNEKVLDDYNLQMYTIQLEELKIAKKDARRKGLRFRLFDATQSMLLRPDGHPSKYGHWPTQNVSLANDCVHWCLPGPIDTWNDFLFELFKREETERSFS
ncbi:hypothetical protein ACH5RR_011329 [Cinchona calisaya]|uniref:Trichome birefringence-like N-terminal domain-containing protein n=1 Tax=Cinchona calisaya TaxID=153742 RepID=A0ABD3A635_9GENT